MLDHGHCNTLHPPSPFPAGQGALVVECVLLIMSFGNAADEVRQMMTYGMEYFNSPWNYMDCLMCVFM